ncbi:MAG: hypothetical protein RB191_05670 [Terriglobia bacterium]|nr:hypothetical protein [Terriglobia bacterium]
MLWCKALAAQIAAAVINFSTLHPKEPVKEKDLMPSQWGRVEPRKAGKERSADEIADEIRTRMAQLIG